MHCHHLGQGWGAASVNGGRVLQKRWWMHASTQQQQQQEQNLHTTKTVTKYNKKHNNSNQKNNNSKKYNYSSNKSQQQQYKTQLHTATKKAYSKVSSFEGCMEWFTVQSCSINLSTFWGFPALPCTWWYEWTLSIFRDINFFKIYLSDSTV